MARSLRRLVAGVLVAGSLVAVAAPAQASVRCYRVNMPVGPDQYFCI